MKFSRCVILLSLIVAYGTAKPSKVNENLGKDQYLAKAKQQITEKFQFPSFCNGVECPKYHLVKKYSGFEHRQYDATQWISTPVTLDGEGISIHYKHLLQYISGFNSAGVHLSITAPVLIMIQLGKDNPENNTMSIFLSANLKDPPMPSNPIVSLQSYPKASLYVRSFDGYALAEDYRKHIEALTEQLTALGLDFNKSFFACNIYDPPTKLTNRHNEVWVVAA
ncbi:heme-binding protein 1-like isoform X2 [Hyla sarda]|nr:heme-binding protein 1-like isoform X2 [Hyla sarda]XP_056423559.1 heme-binding protein 1-like isoform X2 [Hyla sarda]XP_056423560.1 heme-binding protein 1-like isoform X2 [Hyla sarda]